MTSELIHCCHKEGHIFIIAKENCIACGAKWDGHIQYYLPGLDVETPLPDGKDVINVILSGHYDNTRLHILGKCWCKHYHKKIRYEHNDFTQLADGPHILNDKGEDIGLRL